MTKLQIKVTAEQIQRAFAGETVELIPAIAGHSMTIHDIDRVGNIVTVSFHPEPMTTPESSPLSEKTLDAWESSARAARFDGRSVEADPERLLQLIAQARAARPSLWQPIETAPKDGTWILAFGSEAYSTPNRIRSMAWFDEGEWGIGWYDDLGEGRFSPTHWQPLPAPPAQDGGLT